ncbi:MAG: hypothetical protein M1833_004101 [Piccolia ochrophora]|nr:MAG: hypothetical protein M1833_004101 [Piccolia ochrophora]
MAPSVSRRPPQAPPRFDTTPSRILEETKKIIESSRRLQDDLASKITPESASFDDVLLPLAHDENDMAIESHILCFFQAVSADKSLRDASTQAEELFNDFDIESAMREDIFKLVDSILKKGEKLDAESLRFLEKAHRGYIQYGLGIPAGSKRDRFKEIKKRLSQISTTFQKNLNEETGGLWFTQDDLSGVPEDVLLGLEKGHGENVGKLRLTFKYPDYFPAMEYAKSGEVRQKVFVNNENKCNANVPLFKEAVVLRDEAARLLGYPNHATFRIEDKMAKTPKTVDDFLGDLRRRLTPGGGTEIRKLQSLKTKDLESRGESHRDDGRYYLWDQRYYNRLMMEQEYSVDQQKIAEYFPLQTTIEGMLRIFEELFGLLFEEISPGEQRDQLADGNRGTDIVWHEDVKMFSVWDDEGEGGDFVGYLYLDMFPRDGKYGHAANFNLQPGFTTASGKRRYPATALVCNFSKPTAKKPSLLKHDEVVTLFHELGHGIHDLVSRTTYSRFHGTSTVRDFVEAPSQMLENWCWTPSQLKSLSRHYSYLSPDYESAWKEEASAGGVAQKTSKPRETMPDDLIASLIKSKHVNGALFNLRQLHFGIFDMTVHELPSHEAATDLAITEEYNDLRREITQLSGMEAFGASSDWAHGQATFGHLIGGYDAGYYGYLSSQVYSMDMFYSVFKKNPMSGTEGRRYRHTVLERGGSREEMDILEEFLGRKPSTEAFYEELGLTSSGAH